MSFRIVPASKISRHSVRSRRRESLWSSVMGVLLHHAATAASVYYSQKPGFPPIPAEDSEVRAIRCCSRMVGRVPRLLVRVPAWWPRRRRWSHPDRRISAVYGITQGIGKECRDRSPEWSISDAGRVLEFILPHRQENGFGKAAFFCHLRKPPNIQEIFG